MQASPWLVLALLIPQSPPDELLALAPRAGSTRAVTFRAIQELGDAELAVRMNDQEVPPEYLPELDFEVRDELVLGLAETYLDCAAGGPRRWLRRYDEVSWTNAGRLVMSSPAGEHETPWSVEPHTSVAGRTLCFTRSDAGDVERAAADERGGSPAFDALAADLGLAALLSDEPIGAGARWRVDGAKLAALFEPGGELGFELEGLASARARAT